MTGWARHVERVKGEKCTQNFGWDVRKEVITRAPAVGP